ncbi:hypothetical protein BV22DRAFT_1082490, partial [Leucogyrophana mollusca]
MIPTSTDDVVGNMEQSKRDKTFYLTTVVFLVEGTLFRVPRQPFIEGSDFFRQMFLLPVPEDAEADGSSDEHPLCLPEQIKKKDFRQLLKVLFPDYRKTKKSPSTIADWISVLKLSDMWDLEIAKQLAIDHLGPAAIDPVDRICLATDCNVRQWLLPAFNDLAKRKEPIGINDVDKLGIDLALKVAAIRE